MPTVFYTVLTGRDLDALTAYLRSVPSVRHETPAPEYKIALKPEMPTYAGKQANEAELSDKLARGRYLLTIAHCLECHTPEGPSVVHDFAGASGKGGRTFRGPWGESVSPTSPRIPWRASGSGATTKSNVRLRKASRATVTSSSRRWPMLAMPA